MDGTQSGTDPRDPVAVFARQKAGEAARRRDFGLEARRAALAALRAAVVAHEPEIIAALEADFGKPEEETRLTELLPLYNEIAFARRRLRRWMRVRRVAPTRSSLGTRARIRPEPRGTVLIVSPWNYPLNLSLIPLVSALAAGNSAILKPSELAPASAAVIARLVGEAFAPDLVDVVTGGPDVAGALLDLPFDHVFFTGSPAVGRIVMEKAARQLASVTLELGGKSPAIIGPGADLDAAARWVVFGKFSNAGQTCVAPDHIFVHESRRAAFVERLRGEISRAYGDGGGKGYARIISPRHGERLRRLLADALDGGARVLAGGPGEATQMPPTLIEAVTPQMDIETEEIFGPLLPILPFDEIGAVVARINARPKPLALYIFERDRHLAEQIVAATSSGGVGVNLTSLQFAHPSLPFGGVGGSGFGVAHGRHGFRSFSHERAILENRASPMPLLFAPWNRRKRRLIALLARWLG